MPPFVGGEHMEPGREAEAHAAKERVRKSHACQIDARELAQEALGLLMGIEELPRRVGKRRCLPRPR